MRSKSVSTTDLTGEDEEKRSFRQSGALPFQPLPPFVPGGGHNFLIIGEQSATGLREHIPLLIHPFLVGRHRFRNGARRKLVCESGCFDASCPAASHLIQR
jgi:hypothetical protein